jgi:hypothetical protein
MSQAKGGAAIPKTNKKQLQNRTARFANDLQRTAQTKILARGGRRPAIRADVKRYTPGREVGREVNKLDGVRRSEKRRDFRVIDGVVVVPRAGGALLVTVESGRVMMMHRGK